MKNAPLTSLNKYVFRHDGVMNATYQDGHVGQMRLKLPTMNQGHDFAPGVQWTKAPSHVVMPFGARPVNASMGFSESPDVDYY